MKIKHSTFSFLIAVMLFSSFTVLGQTQLLKNLHFEEGGYTLVGIRSESDRNALADSLGDFYTEDISVLNAIKKAWVFRRPSPQYACGYHYRLIILKNGKEVESHGLNLNCHELTTEHGSLYFDTRLLSMFKNKFNKLYARNDDFKSLAEARSYWTKIHTDTRFIYAYTPAWLDFEGSFGFVFKCPPLTESVSNNERSLPNRLVSRLQKPIRPKHRGSPGKDLWETT